GALARQGHQLCVLRLVDEALLAQDVEQCGLDRDVAALLGARRRDQRRCGDRGEEEWESTQGQGGRLRTGGTRGSATARPAAPAMGSGRDCKARAARRRARPAANSAATTVPARA